MKLILVVADTLRRDHLGTYGNTWVQTPNLDALAAEAAVFEQHHIGSFPTVPNRRDMLLGLGDKGHPFNRWRGIDDDEVTLAERLRRDKDIPCMMVTDVANTVSDGRNMYKGFSAWAWNRGQEGDPHWLDNGVPLEFPVEPDLIRYTGEVWHRVLINRAHRRVETDWFAPRTYSTAIEWLERNYTLKDFFLYLDTFDPHEPWDPPPWYEELYDPGFEGRRFEAPTYGAIKQLGITKRELQNIRARYAGEVTMVDTWLGRILATLQRLGIYEETMIIFTADHGAYFGYPGDNGMICKANVLGADGKIMAAGGWMKQPAQYLPHWTGVCRIPLIIRLPGQRRAKRVSAITQPWDIAPTVLEAFGIAKPQELWGKSLIPLTEGKAARTRRAAVLGNPHHAQVMTPRWIYAVWRGQRSPALYDLKADPHQTRDVLSEHPHVVARMQRCVEAYLCQQGLEELVHEYGFDRSGRSSGRIDSGTLWYE
jgi:arylsulfatase A-like enzyme